MSDSQESPTPSKVSTEAAGTCPDELDPELDALLDGSSVMLHFVLMKKQKTMNKLLCAN